MRLCNRRSASAMPWRRLSLSMSKSGRGRVPLNLALEQAAEKRERPLAVRAAAPLLERDAARLPQVRGEILCQLFREPRLEHREVHFVVKSERAVGEVGRADHRPE